MNDRLKKIVIFLAALLLAAGAFGAGMAFAAGGTEPGTQGDPIVTLSYLESRLKNLGDGSSENVGPAGGNGSQNSAGSGFEKISLTKGQSLTVADGSIMIVYSGSGSIGEGTGFLNLSTGELFESGTTAVLYSLFMGIGGNSVLSASGNMTVYIAGRYVLN